MNMQVSLPSLVITEIEGEARVLDLDLAKALGMKRPTNIRITIKACRPSLEEFGPLHSARAMVSIDSGARRAVNAFHLNEEKAAYVTMHCKTDRADAVKVQIVKVFTAWRRGALVEAQPVQPALPNFADPIEAALAFVTAEKKGGVR